MFLPLPRIIIRRKTLEQDISPYKHISSVELATASLCVTHIMLSKTVKVENEIVLRRYNQPPNCAVGISGSSTALFIKQLPRKGHSRKIATGTWINEVL